MLFVDGENLTIRAERYAKENQITLIEGKNYLKETFIWLPNHVPTTNFVEVRSFLAAYATRAYYYTSMKADDTRIDTATEQLWNLGFTPQIFKKIRKEDKAKGVDIALTKDMLMHASQDHYEVACLIAGDGDYVPLVDEVKRLGKIVVCIFFGGNGMSPGLKMACDEFVDVGSEFIRAWKHGATA